MKKLKGVCETCGRGTFRSLRKWAEARDRNEWPPCTSYKCEGPVIPLPRRVCRTCETTLRWNNINDQCDPCREKAHREMIASF